MRKSGKDRIIIGSGAAVLFGVALCVTFVVIGGWRHSEVGLPYLMTVAGLFALGAIAALAVVGTGIMKLHRSHDPAADASEQYQQLEFNE